MRTGRRVRDRASAAPEAIEAAESAASSIDGQVPEIDLSEVLDGAGEPLKGRRGRKTKAKKPAETGKKAPAPRQQKPPTLAHDLGMLLVKIAVVVVAVLALFSFVFGLHRVENNYMEPSIKSGDLLLFYRLDRDVTVGEVAVLEYNGHVTTARVIARSGDTVNIDSEGLLINGSHQIEQGITKDTTQVADGVTFPLVVPDNSVFLLGDNRTEAVDSRIYGCVSNDDIWGTVMGQFRRRGF